MVIASHYASPAGRRVVKRGTLFEGASEESARLGVVQAGEPFDLLDDSLGWAWGYAGSERRVGYVRSACLGR